MTGRGTALAALMILAAISAPATASADAVTLMARTAYFEARSDGSRGMLAVCFTIMNRLKAGTHGDTIGEIVHRPAQFSVWLPGGAARRIGVDARDPHYRLALQAARLALAGAVKDPSHGSTYYHERSIRPGWARGMRRVAVVGRHVFLKPRK
jgi:spore germination cell wall hydrolase CwlJ-like protein